MAAVNLQMVKGAADVWISAWTVKLLASGRAKDVVRLAKKAVKVGAKKDVKIAVKEVVNQPAKDRANLVQKRTLLRLALEESIFLIQLGVRNPLVYLGGMQVTQMEIYQDTIWRDLLIMEAITKFIREIQHLILTQYLKVLRV